MSEADDGRRSEDAPEGRPEATVASEDARPGAAPAEPFSDDELRRAFVRPDLAAEVALGGAERLCRNLAEARGLWWLAGLLLATSLVAAVPYGAVPPTASFWRIAALFTGSLAICFPCLHVFSQFLGFRLRLSQNLALSLVLTSVAGLFTLGFFPIVWFIAATVDAAPGSLVQPKGLSVMLLTLSLVMGMVQMGRCLVSRHGLSRQARPFPALMSVWLVLLAFITYRMALVLALL